MLNKNIKNLLVNKETPIKEAMKIIDRGSLGVAFVVDKKGKLFGVVTDGDIRRAILKGINIKKPIKSIANAKPIIIKSNYGEKEILNIKKRIELPLDGSLKVPLTDKEGKIKDIVFVYNNGRKNIQYFKKKPKVKKEGVKKVLITGGAGYLGSVLCRKLLENGYQVRVLDNLTYGEQGIKQLYKNKNFKFLEGDIRSISKIMEAISGVDAVVHLAAIVGDPACSVNPREAIEINYLSTKIITEICKYFQVNRFVFASSCSVYGKNSSFTKKLTEESSLSPLSLYAETKIKCEEAVLEAIDDNFSPTILRMATLYGYSPNMRFDLVVNLLTAKAIFDKEIPIFGGSQWRPWFHIEDAAKAYVACLEAPIEKIRGEIFNVLSENYKIIEVGRIINSIVKRAELKLNNKINDNRNYSVSFDKITKILKYLPDKKIIDGIKEIKLAAKRGIIKNYKDSKYRTSLPQY